jgi:poly(3-hydroxybutyrate) depolymerase
VHLTAQGAGHYGIFSGRRWREQVYPQVRDFIAGHDTPAAAADAPAAVAPAAGKRGRLRVVGQPPVA